MPETTTSKKRRAVRLDKKRSPATIWVPSTGKRLTRVKKAISYLRRHAWVPADPMDRERAMLVIACNLRLYHQLPFDLSLSLIRKHYNPRVVGIDLAPCPFTDGEILRYYRWAGLPGMFPTLGVNDPKAKNKVAALAFKKEVRVFLKKCTAPEGSCTPGTLLAAFVAFRGGVSVNAIVFGRAVAEATGIRRSTPFGVPTLKGFHIVDQRSVNRIAA